MLITNLLCDGCGRKPNLMEWIRAEMTNSGYAEWRHPGIAFRRGGCEISNMTREKIERLWEDLFQRETPSPLSFLCPECQERVAEELPELLQRDKLREVELLLEDEARRRANRGQYLGAARPWD